MRCTSTSVALLRCASYRAGQIAEKIDQLCTALRFSPGRSTRVLLKPNLLSARSAGHLACTHPAFVAGAAAWFVEQGARVVVGDSPAFGTAKGVMRATGIDKALAGLQVEPVNFDRTVPVRLQGGVNVNVARAALECDLLVNLPRVKAHSQFYMTLAVKNYFGTVVGFQKPCWHFRFGSQAALFASHLVDLLAILPSGVTLIDGIVAMHETGPISGLPFSLGLVGGAVNPVALDTALLQALGLDAARSTIWQVCNTRGLAGADPDKLFYPLLSPDEITVRNFRAREHLKPVSFNPLRIFVGGCRRLAARIKESS